MALFDLERFATHKKTKTLLIKISPAELATAKKNAEKEKVNVSEFIRVLMRCYEESKCNQ
jgi:hypothetical protein